jgi:hypothetical protein
MERMQLQQQQYLNSFPGTPREIYLVTIFLKLLFIYLILLLLLLLLLFYYFFSYPSEAPFRYSTLR